MSAEEATLTASEQAAFDRVLATFGPDVKLLPFEPNEPTGILREADEVLAEDDERSSWRSVDLRKYVGPPDERDAPALLRRSDGEPLLYPRRRNEIHGPYESAKSWLAQRAGFDVLAAGGIVVWIDFEDTPRALVLRLMALGADEEMLGRFRYVQPHEPLTAATEIDLRLELADAALVVVDAANEAMAAAGLDPNVNRDVATWYARIPRLAIKAGAAVLVLDHVAKDPERQRGSVGAGHKQAAIDGASYRLDAVTPFGRGTVGMVRMRLTKDRPGHVRGVLGPGREPVAADVSIDARDPDAIVIELRPPAEGPGWIPTHLMEAVSRFLEDQDERHRNERSSRT